MTDKQAGTSPATSSDDEPINVDRALDLSGLNCPLPVLKTKKTLAQMTGGEVLHASTTDPMSVIDFTVFCERAGHELLRTIERNDESQFEFYIRKTG